MTPKELQDEVFYLIDRIQKSNIKLNENFSIITTSTLNMIYKVEINDLEFKTSLSGIWGINKEIKVEEILEKIKTELRDSNIKNILDEL
jgi:hypothetical protein